MSTEKAVSYMAKNVYRTCNERTQQTRTVWVVFHGIGYLSEFFLKHFRQLDPVHNYIIAPQAPSRYYLGENYEHVGASWATRIHTDMDILNTMAYMDEIYKQEDLGSVPNLVLLGYSQGVSVATRWVAHRKIPCNKLILHSGRIPAELHREDFDHLKSCQVTYVYGTEDPFFDASFLHTEKKRIQEVFPANLQFRPFPGGHRIQSQLIAEIGAE